MKRPTARSRGFTLIELIVAMAITAALAATIVSVVSNITKFWSRTSGRASAEAQGRFVLDQLTLDLQSALYRDDGNTWLAVTIPPNTNQTTLGLWSNTGTTGNAIKPANAAGSLLGISTGNLADARFGIAGAWLRFFTTKRGSNPLTSTATTTASNTSAPVAVGYQIVRRATSSTSPNNTDRRYLLHRAEARPAALSPARNGTLQAGFDIVSTVYQPQSGSGVAANDPAEVKYPTLNSVIAENVIDFGVRMYVYVPDADGALQLTRIFPTSASDLAHAATLPPRIPDADGNYTSCFPEVIDVMVRILTDEGARLLFNYETGRLTAPQGVTAQAYWWQLAVANSQVFTRRIVVHAKPL